MVPCWHPRGARGQPVGGVGELKCPPPGAFLAGNASLWHLFWVPRACVCVRGADSPVWRRAGGVWGTLSSLRGYSPPREDEIPFLKSLGAGRTKPDGDGFCKVSRSDCQSLLCPCPFLPLWAGRLVAENNLSFWRGISLGSSTHCTCSLLPGYLFVKLRMSAIPP